MTASCSCSPGACHGGHTIDMGMPRLTDAELRRFAQPVVPDELAAVSAELLALRAYVTDHEGRCDTLCPRCGDDIGTNAAMAAKISELETWRTHARSVLRLVLKSRQVWCDKAIEQLGDAYAEQARLRARVTELEAELDIQQRSQARLVVQLANAKREQIGYGAEQHRLRLIAFVEDMTHRGDVPAPLREHAANLLKEVDR